MNDCTEHGGTAERVRRAQGQESMSKVGAA
jgi:hypothetical protein